MTTNNKQSNQPEQTEFSKWLEEEFIPFYKNSEEKYICYVIDDYVDCYWVGTPDHPLYELRRRINVILEDTREVSLTEYLGLYRSTKLALTFTEWDKLNIEARIKWLASLR